MNPHSGRRAGNLVRNDTNATWDVFLRDLTAGQTRRLSRLPGTDAGVSPFRLPQVSRDGRQVLFESPVRSLGEVEGVRGLNCFVADLAEETIELLSAGWPSGMEPAVTVARSKLAADGGSVALYVTGVGPLPQALLRNRSTGGAASLFDTLAAATGHPVYRASPIDLSGDGALAVYQMETTNYPAQASYTNAIVLHDLLLGSVAVIAQVTNQFGGNASLPAVAPVLSSGNEAVATWTSAATDAT